MGNDQSINLSTQEKSYAERVKDAQPEFLEAMGKLAEGKFTVSEETKRLIDQEAEALNGDRSGERAIWRAEMTGLLASAINIFTGRPLALSGDLKAETVLIMSFVTNMEATNKVLPPSPTSRKRK